MVSKQSSMLRFLWMWNQRVVKDFKTLNKELGGDKMLTIEIHH